MGFVIAVPLTQAVCPAGCWVHLGLNEEQRKMRCTGLPTVSPRHTSPALGLSSPSVQWARASGLTEIGCWDGWPPGRARKWPPGRFTSAHLVQLWQSVWNWRGLAGLGGQACCSPSAPLQDSRVAWREDGEGVAIGKYTVHTCPLPPSMAQICGEGPFTAQSGQLRSPALPLMNRTGQAGGLSSQTLVSPSANGPAFCHGVPR